jgi:hypothetical protein
MKLHGFECELTDYKEEYELCRAYELRRESAARDAGASSETTAPLQDTKANAVILLPERALISLLCSYPRETPYTRDANSSPKIWTRSLIHPGSDNKSH